MIGKRGQANLHHPPPKTLIELVKLSPWQIPSIPGRAELFSWRTTMSLALADVPLAPVAGQLWPTLAEMADQVGKRLTAQVGGGQRHQGGVSFAAWLDVWREQFEHWHDPLRELVCQQVRRGDAECLAVHLSQVDGFAFADFVLAAVIGHCEREAFRARLLSKPEPAPVLPRMLARPRLSRAPAMNGAIRYLYARFQHHAPFRTEPAPAYAITWSDVSEIYRPQTEADLADRENRS